MTRDDLSLHPADAPSGIPEGSDDDFEWSCDAELIAEQPATAVYVNAHGQVVIRQRAAGYDMWVCFSPEVVPVLIAELKRYLGAPDVTAKVTARPSTSNAARQKRYRDRHRHRNDDADRNVTVEAPALHLAEAAE